MKDKGPTGKSMSEMLEEGLNNAFSTDYYHRFLSFVAGNPNYSYRNVILILQQCPHARKTQGVRAWNKEGRIIKAGEKGLRINALFEKVKEQEDKPPLPPSKRKLEGGEGSRFRRISVFDISQTRSMDGDDAQQPLYLAPGGNALDVARPEGDVPGYDELLRDLREATPLPIVFSDSVEEDASAMLFETVIKKGMSQLHTIRTVIFQISLIWLRAHCPDQKLLQAAARSVTFIISRHLGIDTSGFGFCEVAEYGAGQENVDREEFLDAIQKTALYFIDTLDGIRKARQIRYATREYFLFASKKTAMRLFRQGYLVYLVYPDEGELLVMSKKDLEQDEGPFAVPRGDWFGATPMAA